MNPNVVVEEVLDEDELRDPRFLFIRVTTC